MKILTFSLQMISNIEIEPKKYEQYDKNERRIKEQKKRKKERRRKKKRKLNNTKSIKTRQTTRLLQAIQCTIYFFTIDPACFLKLSLSSKITPGFLTVEESSKPVPLTIIGGIYALALLLITIACVLEA